MAWSGAEARECGILPTSLSLTGSYAPETPVYRKQPQGR